MFTDTDIFHWMSRGFGTLPTSYRVDVPAPPTSAPKPVKEITKHKK